MAGVGGCGRPEGAGHAHQPPGHRRRHRRLFRQPLPCGPPSMLACAVRTALRRVCCHHPCDSGHSSPVRRAPAAVASAAAASADAVQRSGAIPRRRRWRRRTAQRGPASTSGRASEARLVRCRQQRGAAVCFIDHRSCLCGRPDGAALVRDGSAPRSASSGLPFRLFICPDRNTVTPPSPSAVCCCPCQEPVTASSHCCQWAGLISMMLCPWAVRYGLHDDNRLVWRRNSVT